MDPNAPHYIEYVWVNDGTTGKVLAAKQYQATDPSPLLSALLPEGTTSIQAYCYCNLHGLWESPIISC